MKKSDLKLKEFDKIMIVVALFSFSIGIWRNYRQLWLVDNEFIITGVSRLVSVGMFCSAFIAIVITLFSTRVKTKNVMIMTSVIRMLALCGLYILNISEFTGPIKTFVLLTIMCETIYGIGIYPLISTIDKSEYAYKKYALVTYFATDVGIVLCGLMVGVVVGNYIADYNTCLFISLISSLIGTIFLLMFKGIKTKENDDSPEKVQKAFVEIFKNKLSRIYLLHSLFVNIAWDIVYGLLFLILTIKLEWELNLASIFIVIMGIIATLIATLFATKIKIKNPLNAILIKFGIRLIFYAVAYFYTTPLTVIIAIAGVYATSRMCDEKVSGIYINLIDNKYQFTYSNIRYFVAMIGESIGIFLAGFLLDISIQYVFLGGLISNGILTLLGIQMAVEYNRLFGKKSYKN